MEYSIIDQILDNIKVEIEWKLKCHSFYWHSINGHEVNIFRQAPRCTSQFENHPCTCMICISIWIWLVCLTWSHDLVPGIRIIGSVGIQPVLIKIYSRVFLRRDHCGIDVRIVLEQNKFSKKVTSNRDWTCNPRTVVTISCVYSLMPSQLSYLGKH